MNLSTKSKYAIIALLDMLDSSKENHPISLVKIAERQGLPLSYLEQIFIKLRKNGIVKSSRGFYGGYTLAKESNQLSIYDIVSVVDNLKVTSPCKGVHKGCMPQGALCLTHQLWTALDHVLLDFLKKITLWNVFESTVTLFFSPSLNCDSTKNRFENSLSLIECVYEKRA